MKRIICLLAVLICTVSAFGQGSLWKPTMSIVELDNDNHLGTISVFNMPEEGQNHYYLCLGPMGLGDEIIQITLDPVSQLFIPLGCSLEEAQAQLEAFKAQVTGPAGEVTEVTGVLAIGNPSMADPETITVTSRRLIFTRQLEFTAQREGYLRAAFITNSELGTMLNGVKFHRKLYPND